ncbi:hypothetical protein BDZ94DRAFT_1310451 [Collybia nuda]|uniref:Uncharacterized protein n=1 Tax=Collybia nuda TaxID=64659 RepID=A0A9P5Y3E3_9AGAR|nr:hypothetical protein BDZ94DRAFT_1310451 [Collybia nuda]
MFRSFPSSSCQSSRTPEHASRVRPHTTSSSATITTSDPAITPSHTRTFHTIFRQPPVERESPIYPPPPSSATQTTRDPPTTQLHTGPSHTSFIKPPDESEPPLNPPLSSSTAITTSNSAIIPSHTTIIGTHFRKPPFKPKPSKHSHPSPTNAVASRPPVASHLPPTPGVINTSTTSTHTHVEDHRPTDGTILPPPTIRKHTTSKFTTTTKTIRTSPPEQKESHSTKVVPVVHPTPAEGAFQPPRVGLEPTEINHSPQVQSPSLNSQKATLLNTSDTRIIPTGSTPPIHTSTISTPDFRTTASYSATSQPTISYSTTKPLTSPTTSLAGGPQIIQTSSSNHDGIIAGTSSSVALVVILLLLSFCIIRRRRKGKRNHANVGEDGEDRVSFRGNNQGVHGRIASTSPGSQTEEERYSSMYTTAEPSNFGAWSQRSETSLPESINQPAMTMNHLEHYAPTLSSTVSTLPEYVPAQRSMFPPDYLDHRPDDIGRWDDRKSSFETMTEERC